MNAVIRGDVHWIRIGARTDVQDGTVVHVQGGPHPTTIGDEATIGEGRSSTAARSRICA